MPYFECHLLANSTACLHLYTEQSYNADDILTLVKRLITSCNLGQDFCLGAHSLYSSFPLLYQVSAYVPEKRLLGYLEIHQLLVFPTISLVLINLEILELSFSYNRCIRIFLHKHHNDETSGWKPRTGSA